VDQCWEVIDEQTEEAVNSDIFPTIDRSLLEAVVVRDSLTIEEIELFKAVDLWVTRECERQGLAADRTTKRRILEEEVIQAIRFPKLKQEAFANVVLDSEILPKRHRQYSQISEFNLYSASCGFSTNKTIWLCPRCSTMP